MWVLPKFEKKLFTLNSSDSIDLGGKSVPSHDSIYGGWTGIAFLRFLDYLAIFKKLHVKTKNTECAPSLPQQPVKNVLLASSSTDDEKNNHHGYDTLLYFFVDLAKTEFFFRIFCVILKIAKNLVLSVSERKIRVL